MEGKPTSSAPPRAHLVLELDRHLVLGSSRQAALEHAIQGLVGDARGGAHVLELPLVLDGAQPFHDAPGGDELDPFAQGLRQPAVGAHGGVDVVKAETQAAIGGDVGGKALEQIALRLVALEVGDLRGGLLDVAEVGEEDARLGPDERQAVAPGVAGGVPQVHGIGDQQDIDLPLGQRGRDAIRARHVANSRLRRSSASR